MFKYLPDDIEDLPIEVQEENRKLNGKGVYVEILRTGEKRALIYVYRKNKLEADLNREGAENILQTCGYECRGTDCWQMCVVVDIIGVFTSVPGICGIRIVLHAVFR